MVLAGLALSFVTPARSTGGAVLHRCAPPAVALSAPVLSAGPHGHCGHLDLGTCEAALACGSLFSPALTGRGVAFAGPAPLLQAVASRVASVADLFQVGPPTPPPNS